MDRISFVKDCWWNNGSWSVDDTGRQSDENYRIATKLNQQSGYVNLISGADRTFQAITNQTATIPEMVYVEVSVLSGYQYSFDLNVKINDVPIFATTFALGGVFDVDDPGAGGWVSNKSGYFTPTSSQLTELLRNRHSNQTTLSHDVVKLEVNSSNATPSLDQKVASLYIYYSGGTYNNSYTSPTPEIKSLYPSSIYSTNVINSTNTDYTNAAFVSGPTTSSSNDTTWISGVSTNQSSISGSSYNSDYIDFIFNSSGYFAPDNNTRNIDKLVFSMRFNNPSGVITNNQNWCPVKLFVDEFNENIGWGSGLLLDNSVGFDRLETDINFVQNPIATKKLSTSDLMDNFKVRIQGVPKGASISSVSADFYLSNDNMLLMHTPGRVNHQREINSVFNTSFNNYGKNRLKQEGFDTNLFDIAYFELNPGDSIDKNFSTADYWFNYYENQIDTYQYHNHYYKNAIGLRSDQNFRSSFDSTNDYTVFMYCSTSGNYNYLNSATDSIVLSKYTGTLQDFSMHTDGNELHFISYGDDSTPNVGVFNSKANNLIMISKTMVAGIDSLKVYIAENNSTFTNVFNDTRLLRKGSGYIYFGGSGVNDFAGYIHEAGISSSGYDPVNNLSFSRSRQKNDFVLASGYTLELKVPEISGNFNDSFTLRHAIPQLEHPYLYEYHTPQIFAYNTLLTNPSAFTFILDYENHTNNPSGITISGSYTDQYFRDGITLVSDTLYFNKTLPSGSSTIEFTPSNYYSKYIKVNNRYQVQYPLVNFYITSYNNQDHVNDFKINSFEMSFDGWFIPPTGIQTVNLVSMGSQSSNDDVDFYLHNSSAASGIDFFLQAHDNITNTINFNMFAAIYQQSGINFYTSGNYEIYDDFNLFLQGPIPVPSSVNEGSINFFTEGTTPVPTSGLFEFSTYSTANSGLYSKADMYLISEIDSGNLINMYLGTSNEDQLDSINLFLKGGNDFSNHFNMFMYNDVGYVDYELDFWSPSAHTGNSGNINMFIGNSIDTSSNSFDMIVVNNGVDLGLDMYISTVSNWILSTCSWNDDAYWVDSEYWNDLCVDGSSNYVDMFIEGNNSGSSSGYFDMIIDSAESMAYVMVEEPYYE